MATLPAHRGGATDPMPYADVSAHDHKTLRGPRGGMILCKQAYAAPIDKAVFPVCRAVPLSQHRGAAVALNEARSLPSNSTHTTSCPTPNLAAELMAALPRVSGGLTTTSS